MNTCFTSTLFVRIQKGKGVNQQDESPCTRLVYPPFTYKSRSVSSKTLLNDMFACESFIRA